MGRPLLLLGAAAWVVALGAGFAALARYDNTPGALGDRTPREWPSQSGLTRTPGLPALVVVLHPRCPCSRATLDNLARAMPEIQNKARVYLVFADPGGEQGLEQRDLFHIAKGIPHTEIFHDETGREADLFGALTSGETFLYSRDGILQFHGGITLGRSHEGNNPGLSTVVRLIQQGTGNPANGAVFGCALIHSLDRASTANQVSVQ